MDVSRALNVNQCGAYGDNTHDDGAAFGYAFAASHNINCSNGDTYLIETQITGILANTVWDCSGATIDLETSGANTPFIDIEVNNFTAQNVRVIPQGALTGGGGFTFGASQTISNLKFINITMDASSHAGNIVNDFYMGAASNVEIRGCTLISTGYGLLQIGSKTSNDIKVSGCIASDMFADFVNQNGTPSVSSRWIVSGNTFTGSHGYPTPATERRFAGFTSIVGLTVANNIIKNAAVDSCIHVEGNSDNIVLTGNIFTDCEVSGGNDGYVFMLNSPGTWVSAGNIFNYTGAGGGSFAYSTVSGLCTDCNLSSSGDTFYDTSGTASFGAFDVGNDSGGQITITGALELNGAYLVSAFSTNLLSVSNSNVLGTNGIVYQNYLGNTGNGGTHVSIVGNNISCTVWCILSEPNTASSGAPTDWSVTSNHFRGTTVDGVALNRAVNSWCQGNWYGSGLATHTCADSAGANTVDYKNFLEGTG